MLLSRRELRRSKLRDPRYTLFYHQEAFSSRYEPRPGLHSSRIIIINLDGVYWRGRPRGVKESIPCSGCTSRSALIQRAPPSFHGDFLLGLPAATEPRPRSGSSGKLARFSPSKYTNKPLPIYSTCLLSHRCPNSEKRTNGKSKKGFHDC